MNVACTVYAIMTLHFCVCCLQYIGSEGADVCRSVYRIQIASNFSKILAYPYGALDVHTNTSSVGTRTPKLWQRFRQRNVEILSHSRTFCI